MSNTRHNFSLGRALHGNARKEDEDHRVNVQPLACPHISDFTWISYRRKINTQYFTQRK